MKIVVIKGSPREGNTKDLLDAFVKGATDAEISYFDLGNCTVLPCEACNTCGKLEGKCKHDDETNEIFSKIEKADAVVFGTPVYWWGISAQLKAVIDKMYVYNSINYNVPSKKIGLISVGALEVGAIQYELISKQFECICDFLKWDLCFDESFSAYEIGDIRKDAAILEKCEKLYEKFE